MIASSGVNGIAEDIEHIEVTKGTAAGRRTATAAAMVWRVHPVFFFRSRAKPG